MKRLLIIDMAVLLAVIFIFTLAASRFYYRGVYDACVRASTIDGTVTLFDLTNCRELEQHARAERWFFVESIKP